MNRLHRKCVIASAGLHLLLILVLFVGPGFLAPKNTLPDMPILDFIPVETVDELISGGGNPNAKPPPAAPNVRPVAEPAPPPPPAPPKPEPEQKSEPEVLPEPDKKSTEPSLEVAPKPPRLPKVNLKLTERKTASKAAQQARAEADRQAKQYAEYRRKLAGQIGSAANGLPGSISSSTSIEFKGPGGGGVPYANWLQAVKTDYTLAWELPQGIADDDATVAVTVTIARDGSVVSSRITRPSRNGAVDESVRATLARVRKTAPLPRTATEDQRTVTINFNVRAKKLLG